MKNKIVDALSYFSIFFAPVLLPAIIWIAADDDDMKYHAKKAFWLQLAPTLVMIVVLMAIGVTGLATNELYSTSFVAIILLAAAGLFALFFFIYNLYMGIKILIN